MPDTLDPSQTIESGDGGPGLARCLHAAVKRHPLHDAIEYDGRKVTYQELHDRALALSQTLLGEGLRPEEPVGIVTDTGIDHIVAQVAVIYAGGTCCPLNPSIPDKDLQFRLTNASVRWCLADAPHRDRLGNWRVLLIPPDAVAKQQTLGCPPPRDAGPEHVCHLMHTSGSTGHPKAVQIQAQGILQVARDDRSVPTNPADRFAHISMVSFDLSLFEIWVALLRGGTVIPIPRSRMLDMDQLAQTWTALDVTVVLVPAALLPTLVSAHPTVFGRMTAVYSGGEPPHLPAIRTVLETAPPKHLLNGYGPTECCIFSVVHEMTLADTEAQRPAVLDQPVGQTRVRVLDEQGQPVAPGELGELFLGGDGVSPGYLNLPEKTAARFVSHRTIPALDVSCRWFATGDLVRPGPTGEIQVVGRRDNQVKIRGFRIELEGVDAVLLETGLFAGVAACKVEWANDPTNAALVAFVVPAHPDDFDPAAVITALRSRIPGYLVPQLEVCPDLPLTGHGKVDRARLVAECHARVASFRDSARGDNDADNEDDDDDGRGSIIERLRKIWTRLLPSCGRSIRYTDDFLQLGATSLQAAMLLLRIREEFGTRLTAVDVYQHSVLAAMADLVARGDQQFRVQDAHNQSFRRDVDLFDSLRLAPLPGPPAAWQSAGEGHVLLTGATGFVGAFALHRLLTHPSVKSVVCLVRADDPEAARARVLKVQAQYGLPVEVGDKLEVVAGRLEEATLGVGRLAFHRLGDRISAIFHLAAHVNYAHPYAHHRDANVVGTANLLRLQATGRAKRLHFVSTISTFGPTGLVHGRRRVGENDPPLRYVDAVQYDNGYAQSKWVSEKLVADAIQAGFPITIYRPGSVFCHSQTGVGNVADFNTRLMASCLRLGCFPAMPRQSKNFVPVDYVVDAIVHLSCREESIGQGYNLVPEMRQPPTTEMTETFALLAETTGCSLQELPYRDWLERLRAQDDSDPLRPLLAMLDETVLDGRCRWEMYENMPVYETSNLRRHLASDPSLATCPVLDQTLLRKFLAYLKI